VSSNGRAGAHRTLDGLAETPAEVPAPRVESTEQPGSGGEHTALFATVNNLLHRFGIATERLVDVYARGRDMRSADLRALLSIRLAELGRQPQTPGELGQSLLMTSGAVTGLVDRLVRVGHVLREPDHRDRRRIRLRTTERGTALAGELLDIMETRTRDVVAAFSVSDLRIIEHFLATTVAATTGHVWQLEATPSVPRSRN